MTGHGGMAYPAATMTARLLLFPVLALITAIGASVSSFAADTPIDEMRTWTVPGRPGVEAALVRKDGDNLVLRTAEGKEHTVPLTRFSKTDQDYVAALKIQPVPVPASGTTPVPPPTSEDAEGALSGLKPGQAMDASQQAALKTAFDRSLTEKDWAPYRDVVESGVRALLGSLRPELGADSYLKTIADPALLALLVHERFLNHIPEPGLDSMFEFEDGGEFVRWLFGSTPAMEKFLAAFAPEDDAVKALELWQKIWTEVPETRTAFVNPAIACALVFDRRHTTKGAKREQNIPIDGVERCRDFVEAAKANDLETKIDELPVHELVWVVCANVTAEDLAWARAKMSLSQKSFGRAYKMVEYLMDRATDNTNPYETYALEEILEVGGVCRDQAHFSANAARAKGIPAYVVSGDGDRGPHAWLGYKVKDGEWDSSTGRYTGYRTGTSRSPQTGKPVREQVFALFNERDFSDPEPFFRGHRLLWISENYAALENHHAEVALAAFAADAAPRLPATAERWTAALEAHPDATEEQWKELIGSLRRSFRKHPDMLARAAELEGEHISIEENYDELMAAIASERRTIQRKDGERSDLVVILYRREATLIKQRGSADDIIALYRKAYRDLEGDIPAFKQLSRDLVNLVGDDAAKRADAIDLIEKVFRSDIESGNDEYFRQESEASVRKLIDKLKGEE